MQSILTAIFPRLVLRTLK